MKETISEQDVKVKVSTCKCGDVVRTAIAHMMDKQSKKDFSDEVFKYNLSVKEISLQEYQNSKITWCMCEV